MHVNCCINILKKFAAKMQQINKKYCIFAANVLQCKRGGIVQNLGEYLKSARLRKGLSLMDVYKAVGISDSKLSRIENGSNKTETSPGILKTLAGLYEIGLVDIYIIAGYLDDEALLSYEQVFQNVNLLDEQEKNHIQEQINLFTKGRSQDGIQTR